MNQRKSLRNYYGQLYANNFDSLEIIDKLFESHQLPKLAQEEIEVVNSSISTKEIELLF